MTRLLALLVLSGLFAFSGCGAPAPDEGAGGSADAATEGACTASSEVLGEARQLSVFGGACYSLCLGLQAAGCLVVADICITADVVSVGGAAIPCSVAMSVACAAALGMPFSCAAICPA